MSKLTRSDIHSIIRESRSRKYATAKEYWEEHQCSLNASYPHYSAVEAGSKFPDIKFAIAIAKTLKIDLKLICHIWARDQMPDSETKTFFEPVPGAEYQGVPAAARMQLDEFYVFMEQQIPAFTSHPFLWDILMCILAYSESYPLQKSEIAEMLKLDPNKVENAVQWLLEQGLIIHEGMAKEDKEKYKALRKFYHLPNTSKFRAVRDLNFKNASRDLISKITDSELSAKEAYRTTFTRRITRRQAQEFCKHIDDLIGHLGNLEDAGNELYSLTVAFGARAKLPTSSSQHLEKELPH